MFNAVLHALFGHRPKRCIEIDFVLLCEPILSTARRLRDLQIESAAIRMHADLGVVHLEL